MKIGLRLFLAVLLYGLLFVVFTWPLATHFTSAALVVPHSDSYVFLWNVWHFRDAVLAGRNPYVTDWLFYPYGSGLLMHTYTPIMGVLSVVLGNTMLAINAVLLLSYALSGAGAYLLARRWVKSSILALLAGFIFAYSPYKLQRLPEHYTLVLTATVPFFILLFLRAFEFREGWHLPRVRSWAAVAGCFSLGVVTFFSDYYVLFGLLYFSLAYALWFWLKIGQINWLERRTWLKLAAILVVSHFVIRLLRVLGFSENAGIWSGGDVVAYAMPPASSRFIHWDWAARLLNDAKRFNMPGSIETTVFIGYALPLLALALWWMRIKRQRPLSQRYHDQQGRPLAWVLVVFLLFTVPALRIYGHDRLNLPTAILHFIPFFNNIRCPTRWTMMIGLLLPIVAFSALEAAWADRLQRGARIALSVLLTAIVLFEFWPKPYQQASEATIPAVYSEVAKLPGTTLITIPMGLLDGFRQVGKMDPEQMYNQTVHRKKLTTGYLSRLPPDMFTLLDRDPVLSALLHRQVKPDTVAPAQPTPQQVQHFMRTYNPAAFVVDPSYRDQPVTAYLRQLLQPYGYREQVVDGYLLLTPAAK